VTDWIEAERAMTDTVRFSAPLQVWRTAQPGGIGYVLIGGEAAEAASGHELMRRVELGKRRGFGSVKVTVQVGGSEWRTSVFPQRGGGWFLPIKQAIRRAEDLAEGSMVKAELILD